MTITSVRRHAFKQVFKKAGADFAQQKAAFLAFFQDNAEIVRSAVMCKIPTLQSVAAKLRCINVPVRLPAAAAASERAIAAAADAPVKAEMNDNLHCRVVLFMVFSGMDGETADLFKRYYGNEQSSVRGVCPFVYFDGCFLLIIVTGASDGSLMSSSDILRALVEIFNDSVAFDNFCQDDTTVDSLPSILNGLHPEHLPTPGAVVSDQLLTMIRWSRKTATRLIQMYCSFNILLWFNHVFDFPNAGMTRVEN
jgi:hypothetical protein